MKKLSNLKGAKALNKKDQQSINGGAPLGGWCKNGNIVIKGAPNPPNVPNGSYCPGGKCCNGECVDISVICPEL